MSLRPRRDHQRGDRRRGWDRRPQDHRLDVAGGGPVHPVGVGEVEVLRAGDDLRPVGGVERLHELVDRHPGVGRADDAVDDRLRHRLRHVEQLGLGVQRRQVRRVAEERRDEDERDAVLVGDEQRLERGEVAADEQRRAARGRRGREHAVERAAHDGQQVGRLPALIDRLQLVLERVAGRIDVGQDLVEREVVGGDDRQGVRNPHELDRRVAVGLQRVRQVDAGEPVPLLLVDVRPDNHSRHVRSPRAAESLICSGGLVAT